MPHCAVLNASKKHAVSGAHDRIYQIYGPRKRFILDIQDPSKYKLYRSAVCSLYMLSVTGGEIHGELLVIGWIKDLFSSRRFERIAITTSVPAAINCNMVIV